MKITFCHRKRGSQPAFSDNDNRARRPPFCANYSQVPKHGCVFECAVQTCLTANISLVRFVLLSADDTSACRVCPGEEWEDLLKKQNAAGGPWG